MRRQRVDGIETRARLLEAACAVFSAHGFWKASLAEICEHAHANIAAVNYHFGSKDALYVEAWKCAFERSIRTHPPDGGVLSTASAEERFHGRIVALLRRLADPDNPAFDIMHQEMGNPTGLLSKAMHESIEPIREDFCLLIREMLGDCVDEQTVRLCQMSVTAQCFSPMIRERRRNAHSSKEHSFSDRPFVANIDLLAEHIARFSLGGLKALAVENSCSKTLKETSL